MPSTKNPVTTVSPGPGRLPADTVPANALIFPPGSGSSDAALHAHITDPVGAHAASAISTAGSSAWADGTTNPAANAETQLDKIITDLTSVSTVRGLGKITAPARSAWADGTTNPAANADAAFDKIITDLTITSDTYYGLGKISAAAGPDWLDGETNPASNAAIRLDKIISDLTTTSHDLTGRGLGKITISAASAWADGSSNPAGSAANRVIGIIADLTKTSDTYYGLGKISANAASAWADGQTNPASHAANRVNGIISDLSRVDDTRGVGRGIGKISTPNINLKTDLTHYDPTITIGYGTGISTLSTMAEFIRATYRSTILNWETVDTGITFSSSPPGVLISGFDATHDMGYVLCTSDPNGKIFYSPNGTQWSLVTTLSAVLITDGFFYDGTFYICGVGPLGSASLIYTSTDPSNPASWTSVLTISGYALYGFCKSCYTANQFIACGMSMPAGYAVILTITSGSPWAFAVEVDTGSSGLFNKVKSQTTYTQTNVAVGNAGLLYTCIGNPATAIWAQRLISPVPSPTPDFLDLDVDPIGHNWNVVGTKGNFVYAESVTGTWNLSLVTMLSAEWGSQSDYTFYSITCRKDMAHHYAIGVKLPSGAYSTFIVKDGLDGGWYIVDTKLAPSGGYSFFPYTLTTDKYNSYIATLYLSTKNLYIARSMRRLNPITYP